MASKVKHKRTTLERIEKALSPVYFADVNIFSRLYEQESSKDAELWHVTNLVNPPAGTKPNPADLKYEKVNIGDSFGPTWTVHWFKLEISVPSTFAGKEVHLRWDSPAESMLFDEAMVPLQAFSGTPDHQRRCEYLLSRKWEYSEEKKMTFYVEMECCDMFGAGQGGMIEPPDESRMYPIKTAKVIVFNREFYDLFRDLELLHDYAKLYGDDDADDKGYQALYTGNQILNRIHYGELKEAQQVADNFFSEGNGRKAHTIYAVGHCHIDSAWLWNYDVTKRKCARSWMSTVKLMEEYDDFTFACSQAQQLQWVKDLYPEIYEKIKHFVKLGRFIPVGGTWVEMDGNIPSGESFVRQFLYGQKFFQEEFGIRCKEFWLPDTFGYSAQIPQILQHVGVSRFLTQKMSWSLVNKFPHHNFFWEGIDGSSVLVHFPPGDTYHAYCTISEALKTVRNLKDKGRVRESMALFGYGDGGGGPTRQMIERLNRLKDVDGIPKMESSTPDIFFSKLEESSEKLCRWKGELYLELHNGTYTSQAAMKELNRRCEVELQNCEFLVAVAVLTNAITKETAYQLSDRLEKAWKDVLLNQFHDVLPGSSIKRAHDDAEALFLSALSICNDVSSQCLGTIKESEGASFVVVNSLQWTRDFAVQGRTFSVPGFGVSLGYLTDPLVMDGGDAVKSGSVEATVGVADDEALDRFVLRTLNKVAKANFNKLAENLSERIANDRDRVRLLARMIHKKALADALYRNLYAKLTRFLHSKNKKDHLGKEVVTLVMNSFDEAMRQENVSADPLEQRNKELVLLANAEFMCQLFLEQLISKRKMAGILFQACQKGAESHLALEIACMVLSSVGATVVRQSRKRSRNIVAKEPYTIEEAVSALKKIVTSSSLPKRLEFLVIEVLELHSNDWKPRKEREGVEVSVRVHRSQTDGVKEDVPDVITREGVRFREEGENIIIENGMLRAVIDKVGRVVSLQQASSPFEFVKEGLPMNQFVTYQDIPLFWDAWDCMDYHLETRKALNHKEADITEVSVVESTEMKISLRWSLVWNSGTNRECKLVQDIILEAGRNFLEFATSVDWHENRTFLKVEFPSCLNVNEAVYEIQYGQLKRPTHVNTSWDWARFEVCGHRWAALAEPDRGFAVMNDSKYGWSAQGGSLTLSLLRAPKSPDKFCDMRQHKFRYALKPFEGPLEKSGVVQSAKEFNCSLIGLSDVPVSLKSLRMPVTTNQWFTIETDQSAPTVVLDTVKLAERSRAIPGESPAIVVRLYEAHGVRASVRLSTTLPISAWQACSGLEDPLGDIAEMEEEGGERYFEPIFGPFQIRSFILY